MTTVITGGAGFIGSNLAARCLRRGENVVILDNLSRPGTRFNKDWLTSLAGNLTFINGDVRDSAAVGRAVKGADAVYHLAAQVAVTSSVLNPQQDFEINGQGTLNVLEAVRHHAPSAFLAYSSTNKVYGDLDGGSVTVDAGRYVSIDYLDGVPETRPLDFHSPYGCSKGAADQYVRDYARIYGMKTVVFRQSCIYGAHQFGNEDQGWVAHFMIQAMTGRRITVYGDGLQVRDVLHVEDLIDCFDAARQRSTEIKGEIFNVGGGPANTVSLLELINYLEQLLGRRVQFDLADWRPGDQRVYVSNINKAANSLGWEPSIGLANGLTRLRDWLSSNLDRLP